MAVLSSFASTAPSSTSHILTKRNHHINQYQRTTSPGKWRDRKPLPPSSAGSANGHANTGPLAPAPPPGAGTTSVSYQNNNIRQAWIRTLNAASQCTYPLYHQQYHHRYHRDNTRISTHHLHPATLGKHAKPRVSSCDVGVLQAKLGLKRPMGERSGNFGTQQCFP